METIKKDNSGTLPLPENLEKLLTDCTLCPRNCHVNRMAGQIGYCLQTGTLRAARAALHYWEEPCISGTAGSGAVWLSCGDAVRHPDLALFYVLFFHRP